MFGGGILSINLLKLLDPSGPIFAWVSSLIMGLLMVFFLWLYLLSRKESLKIVLDRKGFKLKNPGSSPLHVDWKSVKNVSLEIVNWRGRNVPYMVVVALKASAGERLMLIVPKNQKKGTSLPFVKIAMKSMWEGVESSDSEIMEIVRRNVEEEKTRADNLNLF